MRLAALPALALTACLATHPASTSSSSSASSSSAPDPTRPTWFPFPLGGLAGGVGETDLSALTTEPAGARGSVRVAGGHFVDGGGARIRFYGTNLTATACFPDHAQAPRIAAYLRALGINAVRFHFMDKAGPPVGLLAPDRRGLDAGQLDRLDFFIAALKREGVYADLNLHVARRYPGLDGEAARRFDMGKVLDRFYPPFVELEREYARALLAHENPYTKTTYAAEPAVLAVEMNNENTLLPFWGGSTQNLPEPYASELERQRRAWKDDGSDGGQKPGQGAPGQGANERFLRDAELATVRGLAHFLRADLGLRALLVDTQASYGGLFGLAREAAVSDFVDMHGYWQHPGFPGGVWNSARWWIDNSSQIDAPDGGTLGHMAAYRLADRPFSVSEYNTPAPSDFAAETLPLYAAIAAFQDWDAIYTYTFLDFRTDWSADHILGFFDFAGHPGRMVFSPAAALAFRRALVAPGGEPVTLTVGRALRAAPTDESALPALWTGAGVLGSAVAQRRLQVRLTDGGDEARASAQVPNPDVLVSDTREIEWRTAEPATFLVRAPALRAAAGRVAGHAIVLGDVSLTVAAAPAARSPTGFAAVTLVALDGQPVAASRRLLLSAAGRVENSGMLWDENRSSVGARWGHGPPLAEPVPLALTLPGAGWRADALDGSGRPQRAIPVAPAPAPTGGATVIDTTGIPSLWFLLRR